MFSGEIRQSWLDGAVNSGTDIEGAVRRTPFLQKGYSRQACFKNCVNRVRQTPFMDPTYGDERNQICASQCGVI